MPRPDEMQSASRRQVDAAGRVIGSSLFDVGHVSYVPVAVLTSSVTPSRLTPHWTMNKPQIRAALTRWLT